MKFTDIPPKKRFAAVLAVVILLASFVVYYKLEPFCVEMTGSNFMGIVLCLGTYFFFAANYYLFYKTFFCDEGDGKEKAKAWKGVATLGLISSWLALFVSLPFTIVAYFYYLHGRAKAVRCEKCGTKMKRMAEDLDNKYLSPMQDLEEKLHSVDYDVWVCPKCQSVTIYDFPKKAEEPSPYASKGAVCRCPSCHGMTLVVVDKTKLSNDEHKGTFSFKCEHCGQQYTREYREGRKEDIWSSDFTLLTSSLAPTQPQS